MASSNSVVVATPLTPPVLQVAEPTGRLSRHWALLLQEFPVKLQTPVFLVQLESTVQLTPALTALPSQVPGLVVQVEFAVHEVPALPEFASQAPAIRQPLLLVVPPVQVLAGWLLQ